jgi:hypothetical protein
MNFGFNSNVRVGDALYHVQTEDRGPAHPFIDTVVYLSGRVVHKRSTNYEKYIKGTSEKNLAQWLSDRVSQQHREVIAEIEAGKLPAAGKEKSGSSSEKGGASASLELKLRNPQSWFAGGQIILEIELSDRSSKGAIADADVQAYLEYEAHRTPCSDGRTDAKGCATLQFPMPTDVADGLFLVVRAAKGTRYGELRFRLKSKPRENTPAPVGR